MALTANPSHPGVLLCADESSFGESSTTFDERVPIINPVEEITSGLDQQMIESSRTLQYLNDDAHGFRGVYDVSFPIEMWVTGHGSTTAGAISATQLATNLGRWIGNSAATADGGTVATSPTDADTFSLTSVTCADGGLMRIGAIGDSRGEGQFYRFDDASSPSDPIVLNALAGTPNEGDVVYAAEWIYPNENPLAAGTAVTTERYQVGTANQGYQIHGCYCQSIDLVDWGPQGGPPRVRANMRGARWAVDTSFTFPDTTSVDTFAAAPVAGGSFFLNTVGTTNRSVYDIRDFQATIRLETYPVMGPGATDARQTIIGVRRGRCQLEFSIVLDREAQGTDTWGDVWNTSANSRSYYHMMYTLSAEDGTAVGLYCPKVEIIGSRPVQSNVQGLNRQQVFFRAVTGGTTDTALEMANFVIALG